MGCLFVCESVTLVYCDKTTKSHGAGFGDFFTCIRWSCRIANEKEDLSWGWNVGP